MPPDEPSSASRQGTPAEPTHAPAESTGGEAIVPGTELGLQRIDPDLASYAWLLAMIFTAFVVEGVAKASDISLIVVTALLSATTVLALHVANMRRPVILAGTAVGAALVATTLIQAATGGVDFATAAVADAFLVAIAPPAIMVGVVRRLRATHAVTIEAVVGVLCVYLLLGMCFAFIYGAIDRLGSGHFFAQNVAATASRTQYFSFTTLATLGYGDFTASSNLGHTLSVFEAILGQVYLVTIVSLIVANLGRRGTR
jgi:hypothetical protein